MRTLYALFIGAFLTFCASIPLMAGSASEGHMVIVWHADAHEVWIGSGPHATSLEVAVMKRCNKVMEGGCTIARSEPTGFIAIARRADGMLGTATGLSASAASENALAFCLQAGLNCEVEDVLEVPQKSGRMTFRDPPDKKLLVRRYGAIVWQQPATPPVRLWVASGRTSAALATGDALANCKADVGTGCEVVQGGANTTLVAYTDAKGFLRIIQGKNLDDALLQQDRFCRKNALTCTLKHVVNTAAEGMSVITIKR